MRDKCSSLLLLNLSEAGEAFARKENRSRANPRKPTAVLRRTRGCGPSLGRREARCIDDGEVPGRTSQRATHGAINFLCRRSLPHCKVVSDATRVLSIDVILRNVCEPEMSKRIDFAKERRAQGRSLNTAVREPRPANRARRPTTRHRPASTPKRGVSAKVSKSNGY